LLILKYLLIIFSACAISLSGVLVVFLAKPCVITYLLPTTLTWKLPLYLVQTRQGQGPGVEVDGGRWTEDEIMRITLDDLRDMTPDEEMHDNFRRMFQIMGLIYQNQIEIKERLDRAAGAAV
jgi:hypothetical protein